MKIVPKTAYIVKLFFYFKSALMFHSFLKKNMFLKKSAKPNKSSNFLGIKERFREPTIRHNVHCATNETFLYILYISDI